MVEIHRTEEAGAGLMAMEELQGSPAAAVPAVQEADSIPTGAHAVVVRVHLLVSLSRMAVGVEHRTAAVAPGVASAAVVAAAGAIVVLPVAVAAGAAVEPV